MTVEEYLRVRRFTEALVAPLEPEDCQVQAHPDASPPKWHLAHTTWFFDVFALGGVREEYRTIFNSYYAGVGPSHPRGERGALARPLLREVLAYRGEIDALVEARFSALDPAIIALGVQHEQQHQELLVSDVLLNAWMSPLQPPYVKKDIPRCAPSPLAWIGHEGGRVSVGAGDGFAYDNERPRHERLLAPFQLASRLVTNGEYQAFIDDGGYERPELWLADGWAWAQRERVQGPLYWRRDCEHTLHGEVERDPHAPVCHVSGFEAAAYAEWAGARLPWEHELEIAGPLSQRGLEDGLLHPMGNDLWQWTRSSYEPYPGFRPFAGLAREYNGKFMSGQWVLKGGACVTPRGHVRASYRNYFYPHQRWVFTGIRLAR